MTEPRTNWRSSGHRGRADHRGLAIAAEGQPLPELRGARVLLRPVRAADADRLLQILREPEVARWWGAYDSERVRADLIEVSDEAVYAIESGGEVIGAVTSYEETTPDYRHANMDIFLATDRQGQGLGTEALRLLARHLFRERGHHRLVIDPATTNERAIRAYERLGFRPVGVMRDYERGSDGTWHDGLLMDLLVDDFRDSDP
jgi:aminoglycoside 6'-N-acetyltransferase